MSDVGARVTDVALLAANLAIGGRDGLTASAAGWLLALGLLLIPCAIGAMGAGDLKLLAAIGALKGPYFVLLVALYGSIAGGLLALGYLAVRGRRPALHALARGRLTRLRHDYPQAATMPYAPAIAAGALLALLRTTLAAW